MRAVDDKATTQAAIAQAMREIAEGASIEVTPDRILVGPSLAERLPRGSRVYVPFLPHADFADTVAACRRLLAERMIPVPHLAPRAVKNRSEMHERLAALADAGVDRLMLIAGDRARPAGPFESTLDLLDSGLLLDSGFRCFGIAGHPEGHPQLEAPELERALEMKREYAAETASELWIVTQFVFSSGPTLDWLRRLADAGNTLPVRIGIPGPARLRTLIAYAARCGVGASARILRRRPAAARLLTFWTPDGLVRDLAYHRTPVPLYAGIHVFPFGGVDRSSHWLEALRADDAAIIRAGAAASPPR